MFLDYPLWAQGIFYVWAVMWTNIESKRENMEDGNTNSWAYFYASWALREKLISLGYSLLRYKVFRAYVICFQRIYLSNSISSHIDKADSCSPFSVLKSGRHEGPLRSPFLGHSHSMNTWDDKQVKDSHKSHLTISNVQEELFSEIFHLSALY